MNATLHGWSALGSAVLLGLVLLAVAVVWLRRSHAPGGLVLKWILTAGVLWQLAHTLRPGAEPSLLALMQALLGGGILTLLWRRSLAEFLARPFASLFDGGSEPAEAKPAYSAAQAQRKRGHYVEAIAALREQLAAFPHDFDGQMLLAEIQAENLNDLPGAQITIRRLCQSPGLEPRRLAFAMNSLADWELKYGQDRDAARQALETIIAQLPESELAMLAAQRIAHLASLDQLLAPHDRKTFTITPGVADLGLLDGGGSALAPVGDPAQQVAALVRQLETHPLDTQAREELAGLYADHFQRLDLATDQLEQLVACPGQPVKRVVHWLNQLADLQLKGGAGYETIRATLQRVIEGFPDTAAAQQAARRIDLLRLDLKGQELSPLKKMGVYPQDVGLNRKSTDQL